MITVTKNSMPYGKTSIYNISGVGRYRWARSLKITFPKID